MALAPGWGQRHNLVLRALRKKTSVCPLDVHRNGVRVIVLPESKHRVTHGLESLGGVYISVSIPSDLGKPEVSAGLRLNEVFRTPMPEAAINEDEQAYARECNVGSASPIERQRLADPEPEAVGMQDRPKLEFWLRVTSAIRLHVAPDRGCNGYRNHGIAVRSFCRCHSVPFPRHASRCAA